MLYKLDNEQDKLIDSETYFTGQIMFIYVAVHGYTVISVYSFGKKNLLLKRQSH